MEFGSPGSVMKESHSTEHEDHRKSLFPPTSNQSPNNKHANTRTPVPMPSSNVVSKPHHRYSRLPSSPPFVASMRRYPTVCRRADADTPNLF
jgi:hypothetical protein